MDTSTTSSREVRIHFLYRILAFLFKIVSKEVCVQVCVGVVRQL